MKYKAKDTYKDLPNEVNFCSLGKASTHTILLAGKTIEYNKPIPKKLKETLTEVKTKE
tara:strand:- start:6218 stop:6391 length:174 start_codon:yes stop_codon:yes gene_type:complete